LRVGDTLEQGPRRPVPRWAAPVVTVLVVLAAAYAVTKADGGFSGSADPAGGQSAPSATESETASPEPLPNAKPWPTADGACSNTVNLPLTKVEPLTEPTGLRVLVGGDGLRVVDVDTGRTRRLPGAGQDDDKQVTSLSANGNGVSALRVDCGGNQLFSTGVVFAVDPQSSARRLDVMRVDAVLNGPDTSWGYNYAIDPGDPVVLRPVDGGDPLTMPIGFIPDAATRTDFVGSLNTQASDTFQQPPVLAAMSRSTGQIRRLTRGYLVAVSDAALVTRSSCDENQQCVLTRTSPDKSTRRYPLPRGRVPSSMGHLSAGGQHVAFMLTRREADPRYVLGHPGAPSDIAVLDLTTGALEIVPGVMVAPKSAVGLDYSADGRWLLIALNEGGRARLLVWRSGLARPQESPADLPGRQLYEVPVLDVTAATRLR
jgi:hypothetical protein